MKEIITGNPCRIECITRCGTEISSHITTRAGTLTIALGLVPLWEEHRTAGRGGGPAAGAAPRRAAILTKNVGQISFHEIN
jgi:hypothetical protein